MTSDKLLYVLVCYALLTFCLACCGAFLCTFVRAFREQAELEKMLRAGRRLSPELKRQIAEAIQEELKK